MVEIVGVLPSFHLRRAIYIECRASITGWPGGVIFGTQTGGLLVPVAWLLVWAGFFCRVCASVWASGSNPFPRVRG